MGVIERSPVVRPSRGIASNHDIIARPILAFSAVHFSFYVARSTWFVRPGTWSVRRSVVWLANRRDLRYGRTETLDGCTCADGKCLTTRRCRAQNLPQRLRIPEGATENGQRRTYNGQQTAVSEEPLPDAATHTAGTAPPSPAPRRGSSGGCRRRPDDPAPRRSTWRSCASRLPSCRAWSAPECRCGCRWASLADWCRTEWRSCSL